MKKKELLALAAGGLAAAVGVGLLAARLYAKDDLEDDFFPETDIPAPDGEQPQVILARPESYAESSALAAHLQNGQAIVLDLGSADSEVSRRLLDFLTGVAYAEGGRTTKIDASTYLVTPRNVDISGDGEAL